MKPIITVEEIPIDTGTSALKLLLERMDYKQMEAVKQMIVFYYNQFTKGIQAEGKEELVIAIQEKVDELIRNSFDKKPDKPTCFESPRGCSFCCHIEVDVTHSEAILALKEAADKRLAIDWDRIALQAAGDFKALKHADRRCAFLQPDDTCGIYDKRPLPCRKYLVKTPVRNCDTSLGKQQVAFFADVEIEVLVSVMYMHLSNPEEPTLNLPKMLMKIKNGK